MENRKSSTVRNVAAGTGVIKKTAQILKEQIPKLTVTKIEIKNAFSPDLSSLTTSI